MTALRDYSVSTPCVEWEGDTNDSGYGRLYDPRTQRQYRAHRWVMAQVHGWAAIRGRVIMHLCDNRRCWRYDHLRFGTRSVNHDDMVRKGRMIPPTTKTGEAQHNAKLTDVEVMEIHALRQSGLTLRAIGDQYGVTLQQIHNITTGKQRKGAVHADS